MKEIPELLAQPAVWVITIVGSLLLSILANVITAPLTNWLSKHYKGFRHRRRKVRAEIFKYALELGKDSTYLLNRKLNCIFSLLSYMALFLVSVTMAATFYIVGSHLEFHPIILVFYFPVGIYLGSIVVEFFKRIEAYRTIRIAEKRMYLHEGFNKISSQTEKSHILDSNDKAEFKALDTEIKAKFDLEVFGMSEIEMREILSEKSPAEITKS